MVTFGVPPGLAETGYGYIRVGPEFEPFVRPRAYCVDQFVEKPDLATARSYVGSGEYLWNSGIFALRASVWLAALERFAAGNARGLRARLARGSRQGDAFVPDDEAFCGCPEDSIDYAVMERLDGAGGVARAAVVRLEVGWSDVGAWDALWQIGRKDYDGNVVHGDVCAVETRDALLYSQHRLLACVGMSGVVVIETPDAVLVARRDKGQQVKEVVARLKRDTRAECVNHRKVHRPWGSYDSVDLGERFQVKRITVNPGASLSLQRHYHRAEHWIVVSGTASVTRGEEELLLTENQSIHVPLGVMHRLANPGRVPLQVIEVQTGAYLGEDDIERLHDAYGRADRALALAPRRRRKGGAHEDPGGGRRGLHRLAHDPAAARGRPRTGGARQLLERAPRRGGGHGGDRGGPRRAGR